MEDGAGSAAMAFSEELVDVHLWSDEQGCHRHHDQPDEEHGDLDQEDTDRQRVLGFLTLRGVLRVRIAAPPAAVGACSGVLAGCSCAHAGASIR
ncbi:hypothetical protein ACFFX0_32195 [Citricoccus parietis]|uniref:Uncharacterized protein n=1 Tax=Citricoccus parietis TaxID=592307 RepID=A0ABV5G9M5_9MICC